MGFEIGGGQGTAVAKGGVVKKGLATARFANVIEKESKYPVREGSTEMKKNFEWEVELHNPQGENAWVRVWTNQTLHPKGGLYAFVDAIFDGVPENGISDTEDLIGKLFLIRVIDDHAIEGEDGSFFVNRAYKVTGQGYTLMPFEGDDPFSGTAQEAYVMATAEADGGTEGEEKDFSDIPF